MGKVNQAGVIGGKSVEDMVAEFQARGGQVTKCAPKRARFQSGHGWNARNDRSRAELGLAVG